jgi:hypothetical protein
MAKDKKSFIAYCEWIETFEELEDAEAGKLAKHLFRYVNDLNPVADDKTVKLCFIPIKQSLKRDLKKYEVYIDKQKLNGAKGGRPKKTQITQPFIKEPKKPDSVIVNDSVNVSVKDNVILKITEKETLIKKYNQKGYEWMINKLSNYKLSHGKKYKSDYGAINSWVVKEWSKENKQKTGGTSNLSF